ncbi:MAG TPA: hypothetical protein DCF68_06045 [Cyanothece sp. UBA12306]|nr:hypothetical protein [Cyanothece sp. UBA12306]
MFTKSLDRVGDWNPQLLRELKGRLNKRNMAIASAIAIIGQSFLLLIFSSNLPAEIDPLKHTRNLLNRYCTASPPPEIYKGSYHRGAYCITDLLGHWVIDWQLWWLDIFNTLSVIAIFILLVAGTYLIINDLSKEESRGTLNFIRLSPRSSNNILLGKMLGVPCLIYFLVLWSLPLHLIAGFSANIPFSLIIAFYGVLIAGCAFFFNLALLVGLINANRGMFQGFAGSGAILFFLYLMTLMTFSSGNLVSHSPFDWVTIFYPGTILSYLAESTFLPTKTIGFDYKNIQEFAWYGQDLWHNAALAIGFSIFNYSLWTYWISQALKRHFHNPTATWLSKSNSYWLSGSFIAVLLGFVFQHREYGRVETHILENFAVLQVFILAFVLLLVVALSPHGQTIQDWSRYRHQTEHNRRSLIKDLILGERSPSPVAIAINLGIIFLYLIPAIVFVPLSEGRVWLFSSLLLGLNIILVYAIVAQRMLLLKTPKRYILATASVASLMIVPPICFIFLGAFPDQVITPWLFTFFPLAISLTSSLQSADIITIALSIIVQWLVVALAGFEMTKYLKKAGESQTKNLLQTEKSTVHS